MMYGANPDALPAVKKADIDYSNASVGIHPYRHLQRDPNFSNLTELRRNYPTMITEFTVWDGTSPMQVWNYAEDNGMSWIYLDLRELDGGVGNYGDSVDDPEEWPVDLWK